MTFDLREQESKIHLLEQQLRERLDQCMPRLSARKQLFHGELTNYSIRSLHCDMFIIFPLTLVSPSAVDQSPSPPVRDTGFSSLASPAVEPDDPKSSDSGKRLI